MWNITEVPEIHSERLLLNKIQPRDIENYNKIVLDKDRNLYWGYDDVGSLEGELQFDSFYEVQRLDFDNREALNFAVRLKGEMIGEAVFFDFQEGEVGELGLRIHKDFAGLGYGKEAFGAIVNWAIDTGFLKRVVSKCFKANRASYYMLDANMDFDREDETYFYFKKGV